MRHLRRNNFARIQICDFLLINNNYWNIIHLFASFLSVKNGWLVDAVPLQLEMIVFFLMALFSSFDDWIEKGEKRKG